MNINCLFLQKRLRSPPKSPRLYRTEEEREQLEEVGMKLSTHEDRIKSCEEIMMVVHPSKGKFYLKVWSLLNFEDTSHTKCLAHFKTSVQQHLVPVQRTKNMFPCGRKLILDKKDQRIIPITS